MFWQFQAPEMTENGHNWKNWEFLSEGGAAAPSLVTSGYGLNWGLQGK